MANDEQIERFAALYGTMRPRLLAYAARRTASPEDAADVIAETFEIAWARLDVVPDGEAAVLWLYVTARHVIANYHRRVRHRTEAAERLARGIAPAFASRVDPSDSEHLEALTALSRLSEDDRELLLLSGWEGLNSRQLAYVLGCSPVAVRVRLHNARRRLDDLLEELSIDRKQRRRSRHIGPESNATTAQEVEAR